MTVTRHLKRPTRGQTGQAAPSPVRPCSERGFPGIAVTGDPVRSYRTISTLPDPVSGPSAVCFLLHCPSPRNSLREAWALPSVLPYGARTFLIPNKSGRDRPAVLPVAIIPYSDGECLSSDERSSGSLVEPVSMRTLRLVPRSHIQKPALPAG